MVEVVSEMEGMGVLSWMRWSLGVGMRLQRAGACLDR